MIHLRHLELWFSGTKYRVQRALRWHNSFPFIITNSCIAFEVVIYVSREPGSQLACYTVDNKPEYRL